MSFLRTLLSPLQSIMQQSPSSSRATATARTVFYGTFISLPRVPETSATPTAAPNYPLIVKHGALWVGSEDGRIQGSDWTVGDEDGLTRLIDRMGWCLEGGGGKEMVRIVRAREGRNGFFFPGFIGMSLAFSAACFG